MNITIRPSEKQVDDWINKYVPEKDLFFIEENELQLLQHDLLSVLVIPDKEFFKHSSYIQIQLVNSYEYWNIGKSAQYIIVAQSGWITNLNIEKKKELLERQVLLGRGLIFPLSLFSDPNVIPEEHIVIHEEKPQVVIHKDLWDKIPYKIKREAIMGYALQWDSWSSYDYPEHMPSHLKKFANTFPTISGSNCLAAVLFAISEQEWIIHEWVHQNTFINGLKAAQYSITNEELAKGDIVTWVDKDGIIQHASYHISDKLFFNKNGQVFFNPWKIAHLNELKEQWNEYEMVIYRNKKS